MFTASNGIRVRLGEVGNVLAVVGATGREHTAVGALYAVAIREFFRLEEDERLGRWRWPENENYVVYLETPGNDWVRVWSESNALMVRVNREKALHNYVDRTIYENAARAYFDAHPIRKPILLQAQEDGTDEWFTIRTYPGDPGDRAHADASAHLLESQDVPARVIEGDTP